MPGAVLIFWGINGRRAPEDMPVQLSENSCQLFPTAGRVEAADSVHQMGQDSADVRWGRLQTEQNLTSMKTILLFSGFRGTDAWSCLTHPVTHHHGEEIKVLFCSLLNRKGLLCYRGTNGQKERGRRTPAPAGLAARLSLIHLVSAGLYDEWCGRDIPAFPSHH